VVDIFDGGPLVTCPRDNIRTFRESRRTEIRVADALTAPRRALVANPVMAGFRCAGGDIEVRDGVAYAARETVDSAGLVSGDIALIWSGDAV